MTVDSNAFSTRRDLARFLEVQASRFGENLARAKGLVYIYGMTSIIRNTTRAMGTVEGPDAEVHFSDILRAAVVLVHATLEDFLRSIGTALLPFADEATLNSVPLVGVGSSGRAEKFFLGRLAAHRGKTVLDLIKESVEEHLSTATYNDTTQISVLLVGLGIDVEKVRYLYPKLDEMTKRRHQIVHRADKASPKLDVLEQVEPITAQEVEDWTSAVQEFIAKSIADFVSRTAQGMEKA